MRLCKAIMLIAFMLVFTIAANAQLLTHSLKSEEDAYTAGKTIAEAIALSFLGGMAEEDDQFDYEVLTYKDKYTDGKTTWPAIKVSMKIEAYKTASAEIKAIKEVSFLLVLEAQEASAGKYYVVGTILSPLVNGKKNTDIEGLEGMMYAEAAESVMQVQVDNGKIIIIE